MITTSKIGTIYSHPLNLHMIPLKFHTWPFLNSNLIWDGNRSPLSKFYQMEKNNLPKAYIIYDDVSHHILKMPGSQIAWPKLVRLRKIPNYTDLRHILSETRFSSVISISRCCHLAFNNRRGLGSNDIDLSASLNWTEKILYVSNFLAIYEYTQSYMLSTLHGYYISLHIYPRRANQGQHPSHKGMKPLWFKFIELFITGNEEKDTNGSLPMRRHLFMRQGGSQLPLFLDPVGSITKAFLEYIRYFDLSPRIHNISVAGNGGEDNSETETA